MTKWEELQKIGVTEYREDFSNLNECRLYFKGGSDEDIAQYLFENLPVMSLVYMKGNMAIELQGHDGYKWIIRFSRIEEWQTNQMISSVI